MSATGRGAKRRCFDDYPSPSWVVAAIMPTIQERLPSEPSTLDFSRPTRSESRIGFGDLSESAQRILKGVS